MICAVPFMRTAQEEISRALNETHDALTPVADTQRLLFARVEHGADDHEPSGDGTLAHAQEEPDREESAKVLTCCVGAESDTPNKDVDAARDIDQSWRVIIDRNNCVPHPFSDWETLESQVLGIFEDEIAKIEDRP